jgi:hypothetical protein
MSIRFGENGQNLPRSFSYLQYSGEKSVLKEECIRCQKPKVLFHKVCVDAQTAELFIHRKYVKVCQKGRTQAIFSVMSVSPYFVISWMNDFLNSFYLTKTLLRAKQNVL